MSRPTRAVVTAGLSQPSSTRLLGDQLAAATHRAAAELATLIAGGAGTSVADRYASVTPFEQLLGERRRNIA